MKKITYTFIWFCLCSNMVFGQDSTFTGYACSTIKNDLVEYSTYGFKDKARTKSYEPLTIQPIGSVSKISIGLAILKAQELGFIDLDTDINQYIDFKVINPNIKTNNTITLRHLATHTSGIKDDEKFYIQSYTKGLKASQSLEDFLKSYFNEQGKWKSKKTFGKYPAGNEFNYSNIGSALAAYIIECASELQFDQFTEKYIFQPLGMQNTSWFYKEEQLEMYSQLFDENDKALDYYSLITYPDGGLKTNIVDLSKLLQTLIHGYQGKSVLLEKKSWDIFFAKHFSELKPIKGINPKEPNSGIFIIYAKSGAIGHTGSDPGVSTVMFFNPETKQGKIFMANEDITSQNLETFKTIWSKF